MPLHRSDVTFDAMSIGDGTSAGTAAWESILEGDDAAQAADVLASLADALGNTEIARVYGPSLSRGSAGVSLFLAYLAEARWDQRLRDHAAACLSHAISTVDQVAQDPALFSGVSGIAWTAHHLAGFAHESRVLCSKVDEQLLALTTKASSFQQYDLVSGVVGYGVYALARLDQPLGTTILRQCLDHLSAGATTTAAGTVWISGLEARKAVPHIVSRTANVDLGLAHGVPSAIALLGQACATTLAPTRLRPLVDDAIRWLLAQRLPQTSVSRFATSVRAHEPAAQPRASRLAWCYGDPGLSAALYTAAVCVDETEWTAQALSIARHAAKRRLEGSGVVDAGLCHGAAGNAHIFNRFYQATGEGTFLDAARFWFKQVLAFYRPGTGVGGYRAWRPTGQRGQSPWWHLPGFLEGSAGIGLALLAATSRLPPAWDRVLMLSLPPFIRNHWSTEQQELMARKLQSDSHFSR